MSLVSEILTSTYEIVRKEIARIVPVHRWATVVSISPLRIRFDDQTQPLAATPGKLVGPLVVGDRVDVRHRSPGQPLITGVAGGGGAGIREFTTLAAATAANLPVGALVLVTSGNGHYCRIGDAWKRFYTTADDTTGTVAPSGLTGSIVWQKSGRTVTVHYDLNGNNTTDRQVGQLPEMARPTAYGVKPGAEYAYGTASNNPAYVDGPGGALRVPGQTGTTRRVGIITYVT